MTAVVTAASGYDLGYVWKNQAGKDGAEAAEREQAKGGYYINAAQNGEPPGRWFGKGAEALGLAKGQEVEREPYDKTYSQIHPQTGEQLGRKPSGRDKYDELLNRMKAAEPHATAERIHEMQRIAHTESRRSAPYTDVTVSLVKSVSIFHTSIKENERQERLAGIKAEADGDQAERAARGAAARWWADRDLELQEALQAANQAAMQHLQDWAQTRTGSGVARVNGEDTVKFEPGRARGQFVVAGHQPGRRPAGPHPQSDCADEPDRRRRQVAHGRHRWLARATRRSPRDVRRAPAQRDDAQVRRRVGAAQRRRWLRAEGDHARANREVLDAHAGHRRRDREGR